VNISQLKLRSEKFDDANNNNNNNNNNNKLQMGCRPVAVVIMHVHKYEIRF
jgi:hypothetical protein